MRAKGLILLVLCLLVSGAALAQTTTPAVPSAHAESAWDGTYRRVRVPILMYHYVSDLPADADATRTDLTVAPTMFQAHMQALFSDGYTPISLYQLNDALLVGTPLPAKPVILTFDDGYVYDYTNVLPALRKYGFTATFFIITGTADQNDPAYLSWQQIRAMSDAGMDMESHTKTHPDLRGRDFNFLVYELLGSLQSLEAYTGRTPHMFAYPSGEYDDAVLGVLNSIAVWRAVTTEFGDLETTDNRLELPRLRIHNDTGVVGLEQMLSDS